ncbi:MAG: hypothetical protein J6V62_03180, partial [Paludibacteraceae bacterium]|nr:hypothetical protein [Paludibacteraceae bacterium]
MSNLKELYITDTNLRLDKNIVKGGILPNKFSELSRSVNVVGETVIEGPVYACTLTIEAAPLEIKGAVFTQHEIYVNSDVTGDVVFILVNKPHKRFELDGIDLICEQIMEEN